MQPLKQEERDIVIDFSQNLNPLGAPKYSIFRIIEGVESLTYYAEPWGESVRSACADFLNEHQKHIAIGIGSTQLLFAIPKLFPYKRAVIPFPTFWEYSELNKRAQRPVHPFHTTASSNFVLDLDALEKELKPGDAVFLCNINNPTSQLIQKDKLLKLITKNPEVYFIVDETYLLFHQDFNDLSLKNEACERDNLIVVLSVSKFFALPGVRTGVMISSDKIISMYYNKIYIPYSSTALAELLIPEILKDTAYIKKTYRFVLEERERVLEILRTKFATRLDVVPSSANFFLVKIKTSQTDDEIGNLLKKRNLIVRKGSDLEHLNSSWIRFSLKNRAQNAKLLSALDEILK